MVQSNRHLQRERKPAIKEDHETSTEDPDIRWIPMTAQDALALSTLAVIADQSGTPHIAHTLRCLAAAYEECYLDVEINE